MATMFAFVTGYADVISMLRYKCFSSMMTGNAIMFGRAIANQVSAFDEGPFYYVVIMFAFASGAVLQRVSEHFFPNRGGSVIALPVAALLLIAEVIEVHMPSEQDWTVAGVSHLFGVVASACSTGRMGTHTTMVTGHMLSLANHLSNLMLTGSLTAQDTWKAIMAVMILVGTLAGAILGAFMVAMVNLKVLLMPVPVVLYILLWMHDHLAKPRSIIKKVQHRMRESDEKAAVESGTPEQETSSSDGESSDAGLGV
ncbi:unnamed protein product [Symbiodinium sp. CCMP2592]|nr:unnamed protein product [Symbiodinium sp. CCMP2592]